MSGTTLAYTQVQLTDATSTACQLWSIAAPPSQIPVLAVNITPHSPQCDYFRVYDGPSTASAVLLDLSWNPYCTNANATSSQQGSNASAEEYINGVLLPFLVAATQRFMTVLIYSNQTSTSTTLSTSTTTTDSSTTTTMASTTAQATTIASMTPAAVTVATTTTYDDEEDDVDESDAGSGPSVGILIDQALYGKSVLVTLLTIDIAQVIPVVVRAVM